MHRILLKESGFFYGHLLCFALLCLLRFNTRSREVGKNFQPSFFFISFYLKYFARNKSAIIDLHVKINKPLRSISRFWTGRVQNQYYTTSYFILGLNEQVFESGSTSDQFGHRTQRSPEAHPLKT